MPARIILALVALAFAYHVDVAQAQAGTGAKALQDYEDTVRRADALVATGNAFEAVRLYESAARIAYNNRLATDAAALNQKLAAARSARDARSAPPAGAAVGAPSPENPAVGAPSRPQPAGDAGGPAAPQEFDEMVRYGDGLAAVGEYGDAVRAYERARRTAENNRIAYDRTAIVAKIAAASRARDRPPPASAELIPPPPPPLPRAPGAESGPRFLPQQPGKLLSWSMPRIFTVAENRATEAELQALEANLRRIAGVIGKAPLLNPPTGFDLYTSASLGSIESVEERKRFLAQGLPLHADVFFSAPGYVETHSRSKSTGAVTTGFGTLDDVNCGLRLYVNNPPTFGTTYEDAEGSFFLEPKKSGDLGGLPVFDDVLVVAKPGEPLWEPVSTERVLKYLLPEYRRAADGAVQYVKSRQRAYEDYMSPEAQDKRRREAQALRAAGGASAEDNARRLEVKQRRWEDDARKDAEAAANDPKWQAPIETYQRAQSMLATLDAPGRTAPACVATGSRQGPRSDWKLVPTGTPGCRPMVRANPNLLDARLPRSSLQIMYSRNITGCNKLLDEKKQLRDNPGDCVAIAHLLRQIDWQQLAGLLAR
jgi:tetratricopeptide (TPR) repeat protein